MPRRPLSSIFAPLGSLLVATVLLGAAGLQSLAAGAGLLAAHGRWSAAEREAVSALERYARTGDEAAWDDFRGAVAREPPPASSLGLLPPLDRPLTTWRRADAELLELRSLGDRVREVGSPGAVATLPEIRALHDRLVEADLRVMSELERAVWVLRNAVLVMLGLLVASLVAVSWRTHRRLARAVIRKAVRRSPPAGDHRAHVTLHAIGDAVISTNADDRIEYMNAAAERLTGWTLDEARGQPFASVCSQVEDPQELTPEGSAAEGVEALRSGTLLRRDGVRVPVHERAAPLVDATGETTGSVRVLRDVTREQAYARELAHQATHDGLTGLANRLEFERQLAAVLPVAEGGPAHVLLYFDLDQFKTVNDTCGHSAGDALLRRFSAAVQSQLRSTDVLARLGGDEFCALLRNCPLPQALELAENIRARTAEHRFAWQQRSFAISTSIGVLALEAGIDDVGEALNAADHACYQAKEAGRNRVRLWRSDDRLQPARQSELHWLTRLNNAFDAHRFRLLGQRVQPLAASQSRRMVEVLLRMEDERGQLVAPMAFIPAAERYGLMGRVDRWVIEHSVAALAAASAGQDPPCMLINLSAASLNDPELPAFVSACLERHAIPADRLGFEIAETAAITQLHRAMRLARELKALGCRIVLDDFGGGMSAFVYLRDLKIDFLKIDGNLVCDMTRDPLMYAMVESIHHVARVMGIGTIAEWAEEPPQIDALTVIGADYAQGYAVHRPEALDACLAGILRGQASDRQTADRQAPDATRARNSGPLRLVP